MAKKRKPLMTTLKDVETFRQIVRRHFYPSLTDRVCRLAACELRRRVGGSNDRW